MNIFINRKTWSQFSEEEMNNYVEAVFQHYRKNGFPYYDKNWDRLVKEFMTFMKFDDSHVFNNGEILQTMHCLSLAWAYFPHAFHVRCRHSISPIECFNDDEKLKGAIRKLLQMRDNVSDNRLRQMIKIYGSVQGVSNFRPTAASSIYKHYGEKVVYDMSSGYGGRLLGAVKAGVRYIGTDPCVATYEGLKQLGNDFAKRIDYELHNVGSEELILPEQSIDFAFTSPPYFNTEMYSDEETQSYKKFPTKQDWLEGFLRQTFINVYNALKDDKHMVINIANVRSYPELEDDTIKIAKSVGFSHTNTFKLSLSNASMVKDRKGNKFEPIFEFKKG